MRTKPTRFERIHYTPPPLRNPRRRTPLPPPPPGTVNTANESSNSDNDSPRDDEEDKCMLYQEYAPSSLAQALGMKKLSIRGLLNTYKEPLATMLLEERADISLLQDYVAKVSIVLYDAYEAGMANEDVIKQVERLVEIGQDKLLNHQMGVIV